MVWPFPSKEPLNIDESDEEIGSHSLLKRFTEQSNTIVGLIISRALIWFFIQLSSLAEVMW